MKRQGEDLFKRLKQRASKDRLFLSHDFKNHDTQGGQSPQKIHVSIKQTMI